MWLWTAGGAGFAQSQDFVQLGVIRTPVDMVDVTGNQAYIVSDRTLTVFDISNPEQPAQKGFYAFPDKIWGIKAIGSLVYVAADKFGLGILDVSTAAAPTLRGFFKTPGQSKSVAIVGSTALVADHMSGVNFIDVSNPSKPASLGDFFLEGYARAVASSGSIAVAVDAPTGLYVFDLSKPGGLEPISTQQSVQSPGSVHLSESSEAQGRRVAVLVGSGTLQVYDLTNPATPVKAATFRTPSGRPQGVALKGALAYVADGAAGLQIVDLTTPSMPRIVGAFNTPAPARSVTVTDSVVLVAVVPATAPGSTIPTESSVLILGRRTQAR
jgi:hypothetical protein